jgi:uncharacterized protein (DUF433 family)
MADLTTLTDQGLDPDELRARVGPDPHRPGPDRARLMEEGVPVWAIIGHVLTIGGGAEPTAASEATIAQVADDYAIAPSAILAALLYYAEHRCAIDTRLAINAASVA